MRFLLIVGTFFIILGIIKIYVYRRLREHFLFASRRWLLVILLVLLALGEISLFVIRDSKMSGLQYIAFGSCVVFTYCLFLACICMDIIKIFPKLFQKYYKTHSKNTKQITHVESSPTQLAQTEQSQRRRFLKIIFDIGILALFIGFVFRSFSNALSTPPVRNVYIKLKNLKGVKSIAMIADVHIGKALGKEFLAKIVAKINELKPDIVVIVGDLVDDKIENVKLDLTPLLDLQSREGVYYVAGNHEYYHGVQPIIKYIESLGIQVLHNTNVELEGFNLAGVSDLTGFRFGILKPDLESAKKGLNANKPSVLLSHQPKFVRQHDVSDFDLVLCGHTHAGQVFPLSLLVWLDQRYIHGLYTLPKAKKVEQDSKEQKDTKLYVSSGVGFWGPAIRFLAPSEIVHLKLEEA